ncbi:MAG: hypothetical protein U0Q16_02115 [Bryobacteraceae bacterium]
MMPRRGIALLAVGWLFAAPADYATVRNKVVQIEEERLAPGANGSSRWPKRTLRRRRSAKAVGDGIRVPKVELGAGTATGSGWVDFIKVQTNRGQPPGMLAMLLLRGEKHVSVTVKLKAVKPGEAQVDIQSVEVAGVPVSGSLMQLLIDYYIVPRYPEVVIGKPFELRHKVDRIDISPRGVNVVIRK